MQVEGADSSNLLDNMTTAKKLKGIKNVQKLE